MARHDLEEPNTAPEADRWYNISLGPSFNDHSNHPYSKVFTLRYEFKPASIDKSQPGSLRKGKNNKVTVEYQNNQYGKPKVIFEGVSEDCKENDAVLFFDGESLRLERLHRAVKRLRHVRLPGEYAAAAVPAPAIETHSPPVSEVTNQQSSNRSVAHQVQGHMDPVAIADSDKSYANDPRQSATSSGIEDYKQEDNTDAASETSSREKGSGKGLHIDINLPHQADTDEEIDISEDEEDKGPNAAEALRAQVNAQGHASTSSTSTGTDTSSGSSSSDTESSENDDSEISI